MEMLFLLQELVLSSRDPRVRKPCHVNSGHDKMFCKFELSR